MAAEAAEAVEPVAAAAEAVEPVAAAAEAVEPVEAEARRRNIGGRNRPCGHPGSDPDT